MIKNTSSKKRSRSGIAGGVGRKYIDYGSIGAVAGTGGNCGDEEEQKQCHQQQQKQQQAANGIGSDDELQVTLSSSHHRRRRLRHIYGYASFEEPLAVMRELDDEEDESDDIDDYRGCGLGERRWFKPAARAATAAIFVASLCMVVLVPKPAVTAPYPRVQQQQHQPQRSNDGTWGQYFYVEQLVDHYSNGGDVDDDDESRYYKQRYFASNGEQLGGPGRPMFVVLGGGVDEPASLRYPYIVDDLARQFRADVTQLEHRFYGT